MIQLSRPVLIAGVAGLVAICAIAVAAWRLYLSGEGPAPVIATRSEPRPAVTPPPVTPGAPEPAASSSQAAGPTAAAPSGSVALAPAAPETKPAAAASSPVLPAAPPAPIVAARPEAAQDPGGKPAAGATAGPAPSFDVVRIEPSGEAVVAGRAEPRAQVALTLAGKPLAQTQADADGQFVMLPPKLPPGDHVLGLRATGPNGETTSEQTVAVAVPARGDREPVVALAAPDKPTVVLGGSGPTAAAGRELRITSIEAQQGGALFASGAAPAGANLRLYLNESYVASVAGGADGKWSIRVERGMSPGAYRVRADRVGEDGKVIARVEAPFDYPADLARQVAAAPSAAQPSAAVAPVPATASAPAPAGSAAPTAHTAAAPASAAGPGSAAPAAAANPASSRPGDAQNAVVEELRTARVERGDSLWRISRSIYGEGIRYTQIYDANASQIRNPDLIYPGQVLVVPKTDETKPASGSERKR